MSNLILPYRALTVEEKTFYGDMARSMGCGELADDKIWKTTRVAGLNVARRIADFGYKLSEPREWGNPMDGYGEHVSVFSADGEYLVGSLDLWECFGFSSKPVNIFLEGSDSTKKIDYRKSLELSDKLTAEGIDFKFSPELIELHRQLANATKLQEYLNGCILALGKRNHFIV